MCGIIGTVGHIPSKEAFTRARDAMAHRGPDDADLYWNEPEGVALGHRRLSIIDLSEAGRQPFESSDGRYLIVFNGEIYNYLEIQKEFIGTYDFRTKTDTEVLLAAYIRWGEGCLNKLNGMFAFAIWDREKRELFCARDRLGVKPFFYAIQGETFHFSSEIKGLLAMGIPAKPNESAVFQYLYHGFYDHGPETFYEGILNLRGGEFLVWKNGTYRIESWWNLAEKEQDYTRWPERKVRDTFETLLADAVRLRMRSDVPVGLSLSSGLDSNMLLHYASQISKESLHLFSRCFRSEEYNECSLLDVALTDEQKKKWHRSYFTPEAAFPLVGTLNDVEDQPYGGLLTIAGYHLHQTTREMFVPVILEGQGLDEILGGYKYYRMELEKDLRGEDTGNKASFLEYSQDTTSLIDRSILDKSFVDSFVGLRLSFDTPFRSHLLNAQYQDLRHTKLPRVLRFNDHVSMSHGRELRMPFLDYRLVEFCFFLPSRYKIHEGEQKVLAREVARQYISPVVYTKQKKAYGAVQVEWLRKYYKDEIFSILRSDSFRARRYWNHERVMDAAEKFFAGEGMNSFFLWQCVNLELWFRKFIDSK